MTEPPEPASDFEIDLRIRICAVCGRVLDFWRDLEDPADFRWQHNFGSLTDGEGDHPAVPVFPSEAPTVGFCDFCYAPAPTLELPVADFAFPGLTNDASMGNWCCCVDCGALIDAGNWSAVLRKAIQTHEVRTGKRMSPGTQTMLRAMYRKLRAHVTGPVRPLHWPDPPAGAM